MKSRNRIGSDNFIQILVFVFMTHGVVYQFVPEDIYNDSSPFRYIKYGVVLLLLLFMFNVKKVVWCTMTFYWYFIYFL